MKKKLLLALLLALSIALAGCGGNNNVGDPKLTGITATFTQGTMKVYGSTQLNTLKSKLVVKAQYSGDKAEETLAAADYTLSGTLTGGTESTITATYIDKTATFKVTVLEGEPEILPYFETETTFYGDISVELDVSELGFPGLTTLPLSLMLTSSKVVLDTEGGWVMTSEMGSLALAFFTNLDNPIIRTGTYMIIGDGSEIYVIPDPNPDPEAEDDPEFTATIETLEDGCLLIPWEVIGFPIDYYTSHDPVDYDVHFPSYFPYPEGILGEKNTFDYAINFIYDAATGTGIWENMASATIMFTERGSYRMEALGDSILMKAGAYKLVVENGEIVSVLMLEAGESSYIECSLIKLTHPVYEYITYYVLIYEDAVFYSNANMIGTYS